MSQVPPPGPIPPPPLQQQQWQQPVQPLGYASPMISQNPGAAWRKGNQLVTTREADLGDACVKCGAPAEGWRWNKTMYWISPVWVLLIFLPFGLIILLIVYLAVRKSAKVSAGLCPAHRARRRNGLVITTLLAVAGFIGLVAGITIAAESKSGDAPIGPFILVGGIVLLIASAVTGTTLARVLAPRKIDDHYAWFRGAGEGYLRQLSVIG